MSSFYCWSPCHKLDITALISFYLIAAVFNTFYEFFSIVLVAGCKLHYSLKSIVIYPFEAHNFGLEEFTKYATKAKEFSIKKTWKGNR